MEKIVEQCNGCQRVNGDFCGACAVPAAKWRNGTCNMATHIVKKSVEAKKVNPMKASKRAARAASAAKAANAQK